MKDPLCAQSCAPRPPSSDVPHSGTLLHFDVHIVTESYGSNRACSVYVWSQHQPARDGHHDCRVSCATPLRVTGDDWDQPKIHRIHRGVPNATRTKIMMLPSRSRDGCVLHGQGCCEGRQCVVTAVLTASYSQVCSMHESTVLFQHENKRLSK